MTSYRPDPRILEFGGAPIYDPVRPARFPQHVTRYRNQRWAEKVGLGDLSDDQWIEHFGRFAPLADNLPQPLAIRYHGHQFRTYNPDIGDGRGFLFAQLRDDQNRTLDLATKGTGQTPYSRTADGRLTLKGGVREILATEMLEALGVYTSKTFSVVETGESLHRNDEPSPTRSCALTRLGHSHVRFGVFQRLAFEKNSDAILRLADYCVRAFEPDLTGLSQAEQIAAWYGRVVARTARLTAQWMAAGFVHGVLNTDNMNVTGESFDYGPWRFLPVVDFSFTAAYFDQTGLYAYGRQPDAAMWNLSRFGGVLSLVGDDAALNDALQSFAPAFEAEMVEAFFRRLGVTPDGANNFAFVTDLLQWMERTEVPFERFFFDWFCGRASIDRAASSPYAALYLGEEFAALRAQIEAFEPDRPARLAHPYFAGAPCTMLIDEVEAIWAAIADHDDWTALSEKLGQIGAMRDASGFAASEFKSYAAD